ncbi:MAG: thymidylate synthase [Lachnospiraceae bacterium]|nr:thymidylate synthase [Lachnospiraceae bacterium]
MSYFVNGNTADSVYTEIYKEIINNGNSNILSRNGKTKELLHVGLTIKNPRERWITVRNPIISIAYAIAEVIFIMNGCNEARLINFFNPSLPKFQGITDNYPGAYGYRLRYAHNIDQIATAYEALLYNPNSRQVVLEIWNPKMDLPNKEGIPNNEDIPCNICSLLKVRGEKLYWTQVMRSNDFMLGLPYNIVQFTSIQEIMAGWLKLDVGEYVHFSDSMHIYNNGKFELKDKGILVENKDDLRLPKVESDRVLFELIKKMQELLEAKDKKEFIKHYINNSSLPEAYMNWLVILCIYTVIKYIGSDMELLYDCKEKCSNQVYKYMINEWIQRRIKK